MENIFPPNLHSILETVFDNTQEPMLLIEHRDGEFRYVLNNVAHQKISGMQDVGGTTPAQFFHEELKERLLGHYRKCISTCNKVSYEETFDFKPGQRVWQTVLTPVMGVYGADYIISASKDVTELKEALEENLALSRRLHSMFQNHSTVMTIIDPVTWQILNANPAACDFYGYTLEEIKKLRISEISLLPQEELSRVLMEANEVNQRYVIFPERMKNGEIRMVDVYLSPISDGGKTLLYATVIDVTDREILRHELIHEKEILHTTLQSIGDGVVTTDKSGAITSLNGIAQELTGWSQSEAEGRNFTEVFRLENEETGMTVENPVKKVLETGRIVGLANHTVLINKCGRITPIADSAAPIRSENGEIFGVVMVFRDVSKEKEKNEEIRYLSYHDMLTGLYNRYYMESALQWINTKENLPIAVIMGDVNGLKITNDIFGHRAGDSLLQNVAETLRNTCRGDDLIARWGGDEFVIFMPKTDMTTAERVIRRIKNNCIDASQGTLRVSLSLGCSVKYDEDIDLLSVMQSAEEHMYHQKLLDGKSYRNAIINTLLATLYEKSIETEEHTERLGDFCLSLGKKLNLSSKEMDELSLLAVLHDIGKVGINQVILQKPTELIDTEWEEMKRHPEIGYRIAQAAPELTTAAEYILSHHERWDGTGYPRGLKNEDIPLVCRILAVADAYDAMTNDRAYRIAMSSEDAVQELKRNAGTQFDPLIVEIFIETINQKDQN